MIARPSDRPAPLMSLLRGVGVIAYIIVLSAGVLVLYAGIQNYSDVETQGSAFGTTVLGIAITSLPFAVYFTAKTARSYARSKSRYELPDTPLRFFLYTACSAGFLLLSLVSLLLYVMYSRS
jgi:hypothetical protein